jgi:hypothetical protein
LFFVAQLNNTKSTTLELGVKLKMLPFLRRNSTNDKLK